MAKPMTRDEWMAWLEKAWDGAEERNKLAAWMMEPVAWMVYTLDGTDAFVTLNPTDFTENHRALPLYTTPQPQEFVCSTDKEKLAQWLIQRGYATGHGDSIEDMLKELEWQIREREREACAKVAEQWPYEDERMFSIAQAIRARVEQ